MNSENMKNSYWVTTEFDIAMGHEPWQVEADSLTAALTDSDLRACDYYDEDTWPAHVGDRVVVIAWRDHAGPPPYPSSRIERRLK